jgi:hypothetical protein
MVPARKESIGAAETPAMPRPRAMAVRLSKKLLRIALFSVANAEGLDDSRFRQHMGVREHGGSNLDCDFYLLRPDFPGEDAR